MTVLAYPPIAEPSLPMALPPRRFAAQLDLLADMGLPVIPLAAAVSKPGPGIAMTFDGGHRQIYSLAYPLLASRGLVATVYVMTGHVSSPGPLPGGGQAMSWAMLRELAQAGWTIGSQGVRSVRLTALAGGALAEELAASRKALEDGLGIPCVKATWQTMISLWDALWNISHTRPIGKTCSLSSLRTMLKMAWITWMHTEVCSC